MATTRDDRIARLSASANLAAKLKLVVEDDHINRHLDGLERDLIEQMIVAKSSDVRDLCAAEVRAMRMVRAKLRALASGSSYAERRLEAMSQDNETDHG